MIRNLPGSIRQGLTFLPALAISSWAWNASAATVFQDDFEADSSAAWLVFDGAETGPSDFEARFNFDYSTQGIPPAPHSSGGSTRGLRLTVNKADDIQDRAAVTVFPKDKSFSGNFVLRFDMWINYPGGAFGAGGTGSTEFSLFGINHVGDKVTWPFGTDTDGLVFAATGEGGANRDYRAYEGVPGAALTELQGAAGGFLDRDGAGGIEQENFTLPADHPLAVMFPSPAYESQGSIGKHWIEVEVRQENNEVIWVLNGYQMARRSNTSAWTSGNIMLGYTDLFPSIAAPANLAFVLYDNVRVETLDGPAIAVVTAENGDTTATEPSGDNASVILRRSGGDLTQPLTVNLSTRGTATKDSDYQALPESVTFPANADVLTVDVQVLDDAKGEKLETVLVDVAAGSGYEVGAPFRGKVEIADDGDITSVGVVALDALSYERQDLDTMTFQVTRNGDESTDLTVQFSLSGTAQNGADYTAADLTVTIPALSTTAIVTLTPEDDSEIEGGESVTLTLEQGEGYVVAATNPSASASITDDDLPSGTVLFNEDFDNDVSGQWKFSFNAANGVEDYQFEISHDYSAESIPASPHGSGTTRGLKATVNKNDATASAAALNLYPIGLALNGDYSVRFDMFVHYNPAVAGTTEHAIFGVNHSGTATNRHGLAGSDGVWFAVETDGSASGGGRSYVSYLGNPTAAPTFLNRTATEFASVFTRPPYAAAGAASGQWVDVEVRQVADSITLFINGNNLFTRTAAPYTSGTLMLGHMDSFGSVGSVDNYTLFDNLRVIGLGQNRPSLQATRDGTALVIQFTGTLESATQPAGPYTAVEGAASPLRIEPTAQPGQSYYRSRNP
ncbi:MAG: hypothetical protein JNN07_16390 [Verrucomicrobiales bacterium]|nr:hypothetical protein [Verrucomicrobiales bacterium]